MYCPNFSSRDDLFWAAFKVRPAQNMVPACRKQWQLTQKVRPQKEMVGYFSITASLDRLDYDCVVVAGSVHVLGSLRSGHFAMKSKHTFTFCESAEWVHSGVLSAFKSRPFINPRRACIARVTALGLCVCVCVCVCYSTSHFSRDYSCHKWY